jgi:hypothetical protein
MRICTIDGCKTEHHARGLCSTHYYQHRRSGDWTPVAPPPDIDGLGVCECPISWPAPKCCVFCGFPSVHRMNPDTRDRALTRQPQLANQVIVSLERGAA